VISLPARGGYGLPTLYFLIQFAALSIQRSHLTRVAGFSRGVVGRIYTFVFIVAPLPLLFHAPFLRRVILPFARAIGAF
jgi:hypothetical protein